VEFYGGTFEYTGTESGEILPLYLDYVGVKQMAILNVTPPIYIKLFENGNLKLMSEKPIQWDISIGYWGSTRA